jgi:hypothetical protein
MGKAQNSRQAITIRFDENDTALTEWLGQFAHNQAMTKVVKLACYLLSGIQPEEGLLALLPEIHKESATPSLAQEIPMPTAREETNDALAAVMQELAALRAELGRQRPAQSQPSTSNHRETAPPSPSATLPEEAPVDRGPVRSSGLDMGGPRRKRTLPLDPVSTSPPMRGEFDPEAARRELVKSIYAFSKKSPRGY